MIDDLLCHYVLLFYYDPVGWCLARIKWFYLYSIALSWAAFRILYVSHILVVHRVSCRCDC